MSNDFLALIAQHKLELLTAKKAYYENLIKNMRSTGQRRYEVFKKAISKEGQINLIAEVKKASPSAGLIREDFNATKIANIYIKNQAAAISVLTEEKYFLGKFAYLAAISENCPLPILMKDFIVHEFQIYEGLFYGASAILLIVAMLTDAQLENLMKVAHGLGLDCLVEVHNQPELERAIKVGAEIIGVNNRNLKDLQVDLNTSLSLIPQIPKGTIIVAESGLKTHDDILRVKAAGAHAVLIGETFMRSPDIALKINEIMFAK